MHLREPAVILWDSGRLDEALALRKKEEAIYVELGNKSGWVLLLELGAPSA